MSENKKKQFGVWMDSHHATVIGRQNVETGDFVVLTHAKNTGRESNSNENAANNQEKNMMIKFFKEISSHMQNAEEVHITGTGTVQEQFINYLASTPQFKNTVTKESTSNKMNDEKLLEFFKQQFN